MRIEQNDGMSSQLGMCLPSTTSTPGLLLAEAHGFFNSNGELLLQQLKVFVRWQIDSVETVKNQLNGNTSSILLHDIPCVRFRQVTNVTSLFNSEASRAIASLQIFKPIHRNARGSGCELQHS